MPPPPVGQQQPVQVFGPSPKHTLPPLTGAHKAATIFWRVTMPDLTCHLTSVPVKCFVQVQFSCPGAVGVSGRRAEPHPMLPSRSDFFLRCCGSGSSQVLCPSVR